MSLLRLPISPPGQIVKLLIRSLIFVELNLRFSHKYYVNNINYEIKDTSAALATQIRDAVPSPDGKQLAFTVLNRLYVMDYPNGTAKRITNHNFIEAMPAWSPDGKQIVFSTWASNGGHIVSVDMNGESSEKGYAKAASDDYAKRQKEAVNASLFKADLVITTAMVPGRKSPVLITADQVEQMKNGAVIIDLAAAQGGNCELSKLNKTVIKDGVKIIGTTISPESVSTNASDLYAKNMYNFLVHLTDETNFKWELEEEITDGTLIVHNGKIRKNGKTE